MSRKQLEISLWLCASVFAFGFGAPGQRRPAAPAPAKAPASAEASAGKPAGKPASRAPAPRAERTVPFRAGETLAYDVSWSSYLTAGTATVTVREKKPSFNSVAYYIVAEGRPTPLLSRLYTLYYKADTLLDVYTLLPQRGSVYSEEGRRRRLKVTRFDHPARKAQFEFQAGNVMRPGGGGAPPLRKDLALPPYAQDALSAIYVLRAVPLKSGARMTMPIVDNGRVYKVEMVIGGRELVQTGIGAVNAWRVTPTIRDEKGESEGNKLGLWITDDARRLPVKLEAELLVGSFRLTLREAR